MTVEDKKTAVREQFSGTADNYANSPVHSGGDDLAVMVAAANPQGHERLLDVGSGAGPVVRAFHDRVAELVGLDFAPGMLQRAAADLPFATFVPGDAEELPFEDASFDIVTCRVCAHHFPNWERAIQEAARVLKPGGVYVLDDNYAPEDEDLAEFLNRFEVTRDPSHVELRPLSRWKQVFTDAGLTFDVAMQTTKTLDFQSWVDRARTPAAAVAKLREQFTTAGPAARAAFKIETDPLRFDIPWTIAVGRKAGGQ